jgi:hypothetical protein
MKNKLDQAQDLVMCDMSQQKGTNKRIYQIWNT